MRLTSSSVFVTVLAASSVTAAAAHEAHIILSPESPRNQGAPPQISAEQSALIFAQRLGLSDGLSLVQASSETIDYLNRFGSHERRLFEESPREDKARWLAVVEGVADMQIILPPRYGDPKVAFTVDNPPSSSSNQKLIDDLAAHGSPCRDCHTVAFEGIEKYEKNIITVGDSHMIHFTQLKDILEKQDSNSQDYQTEMLHINEFLTSLLDSNIVLTIALMPPATKSSIFSKSPSSYGTSHLAKHRRASAQHHHILESRQQGSAGGRLDVNPDTTKQGVPTDHDTDAGLAEPSDLDNVTYINQVAAAQMNSEGPAPLPQPPSDAPVRPAQNDTPYNNGSAPRGILPACFSTLLDCQRTTFNCSGHGACRQKYAFENDRCFSCECVAEKPAGANKTVYWGGPACQKKDISAPFWLLAGVSIGLVSTIGWGIGLLVSMGSEELPSVIGAGVAGPRPK